MTRTRIPIGGPLVLALLAGAQSVRGLGISPAYVDVVVDPKVRASGEFNVSNTGTGAERYRINSVNFVFAKDGGIQRLAADDPKALSSWIIFNPKEFTIPAQSKQVIRFVVSPKGTPPAGEYTAGMELENLDTTSTTATGPDGHDMKIKMVSSILVPIFAQMGSVTHKAELKEPGFEIVNNDLGFHTVLGNLGTGRLLVTGEFELLDSSGLSVEKGLLPKAYVLRESERLLNAPLKASIPDGKYTVKVKISSPQLDKPMMQEAIVDWKRPIPATAAAGGATTRLDAAATPGIVPAATRAATNPGP